MCPAPHRADPIWRTFHRSDQVTDPIKTARSEGSLAAVSRPGERLVRGPGVQRDAAGGKLLGPATGSLPAGETAR